MARQLKSEPIGARVSVDLREKMEEYSEKRDISIGELVRRAIQEYLWSHPLE